MVFLIILISIISLTVNLEMSIMIIFLLIITTFVYSAMFSAISIDTAFLIIFFALHFSAFESAIIGMMVAAGLGLLYVPYITLFFVMQYIIRVKKSSKEEAQIKEQIKGLRRYLRDYSKIEERELNSLVIWEDYLIIAIALKLNKKTINYFYDYCKNNLNDEFGNSLNSFGTYYYMDAMSRTAFSNYAHSSSSSSSRGSSYSGSRGGFSGGSSSGGGGRRPVEEEVLSKVNKK